MTKTIEAIITEPDGTARLETIDATAQGIKAHVGGWLEAVSGVMGEWVAYGDEEGLLKRLQPNGLAAGICMAMRGTPVAPVGTVVFVGMRYAGAEDGYTETDVPEDLRALVFPLGTDRND